jgi:molybdopterin/thiamine biosynthesis adenylyltransferase
VKAIKLLTGYGTPASGKIVMYDAMTCQFREMKLMRHPQGTDSAHQRGHHAGFDAGEGIFAKQAAQAAVAGYQTPLVSGAAIRMEGQISVFTYQQGEPCYRCLSPGVELVTDVDVVGAVEHQIVPGNLRRQRRFIQ